ARESGGFATNAYRKNSYVVYPNGEVRTTKHFLFIRSYPNITAGSEVYIPVKDKKKLSTGEIIGIAGSLTSVAALIIALINTTK
ncbi:MAG: polysialic acid transport protein, partial [Chitinophagaceae bacterium]|nr:polysialic acid transport protein [Chitinophagaceae bacterium]